MLAHIRLFFAAFSLAILSGFSFGVISSPMAAHAVGVAVPFGGMVTSYVPPTPPFCPAHVVLKNYARIGIPVIGLVVSPPGYLYDYKNIIARYFIGKYVSAPILSCATPYPVFPFEFTGTSLY